MRYIRFNVLRIPGTDQFDTISRMSTDGTVDIGNQPIRRNPIPTYLVASEKFETTLSIVRVEKAKFLLQDLSPDPDKHLGITPIYEATASYMVQMIQAYDVINGQIQGVFEFRGRGGTVSLALAK